MKKFIYFIIIVITLSTVMVLAAEVFIGTTSIDVISFHEQNQNVVKQQYDSSCGPASVATILKYAFGENQVTEKQIFDLVIKNKKITAEKILSFSDNPLEQTTIASILTQMGKSSLSNLEEVEIFGKALGNQKDKFTETFLKNYGIFLIPDFDDLKYAIEQTGHKADTRKMELEGEKGLRQMVQDRELLVIVHVEKPPDIPNHFTHIRGFCGNQVYFADPSRGNVRKDISEFSEMGTDKPGKNGRNTFRVLWIQNNQKSDRQPPVNLLQLPEVCYKNN